MSSTVAVARLVDILARQRAALETLAYRNHVCCLLLGSGGGHSLDLAVDDLVDAEDEVAGLDVLRAAASADLAARLGLDPATHRLRDLVDALGDEGVELDRHTTEMKRISEAAQRSRHLAHDMADRQLKLVSDRAESLNDALGAVAYDDRGRPVSTGV